MDKTELLLSRMCELLGEIRDSLHAISKFSSKETAQKIKESRARIKAINKQLLTEAALKTQERIIKNG